MITTWNEIKSFASRNNSELQYINDGDGYLVFTARCGVVLETKIQWESTECIDFETNYKNVINKSIAPYAYPFASKKIGQFGLFKRLTGVTFDLLAASTTTVDFVIPYNNCKLDGVDILWAPEGVTADFKVLDTPTGTLSGVPNYPLNQFAFSAAIEKDFHREKSQYDADLIKDLKIRFILTYAGLTGKPMAVNLHLHEVKA